MTKIIETIQDENGVYKPSEIKITEEEIEKDKLTQFLDGAEKGIDAINRIVSIFSKAKRGIKI